MQDSGRWDIESHSYNAHGNIITDANGSTGPFLSNEEWLVNESRNETFDEYYARVDNDYKTARRLLEKEFNKTVIAFAFPYGEGEYNNKSIEDPDKKFFDIGEKTYKLMFQQFRPATDTSFRGNYIDRGQNFYSLKRLSIGTWSAETLLLEMEASQPLSMPYTEKFENEKGWVYVWGSNEKRNIDTLRINNYDNSPTGGLVYLDGSYLWMDYIYSGIVKGNYSSVLLLARFTDSQNYVECGFTNNSVSISNNRDRKFTEISQSPVRVSNSDKISISVVQNNVGCYVNDILIVEHNVENLSSHGGIGVKVESIAKNDSVEISSISVDYPFYKS
jgi:hypothetical protein